MILEIVWNNLRKFFVETKISEEIPSKPSTKQRQSYFLNHLGEFFYRLTQEPETTQFSVRYLKSNKLVLKLLFDHVQKTSKYFHVDNTACTREFRAYQKGFIDCGALLRTDFSQNINSLEHFLEQATFNGLSLFHEKSRARIENTPKIKGQFIRKKLDYITTASYDGGPSYNRISYMSVNRQKEIQQQMDHLTYVLEKYKTSKKAVSFANTKKMQTLLNIKDFLEFSNYCQEDPRKVLLLLHEKLNDLDLDKKTLFNNYAKEIRDNLNANIRLRLSNITTIQDQSQNAGKITLTQQEYDEAIEKAKKEGYDSACIKKQTNVVKKSPIGKYNPIIYVYKKLRGPLKITANSNSNPEMYQKLNPQGSSSFIDSTI